jgi:hypothetical protein
MHISSKLVLWISVLCIVITSFTYYPKWSKQGSEATISWDVAGYYWYLPSIFIYKDIKLQRFSPTIMQKYAPIPEVQHYSKHRSGYYILRYSLGQALQYLPFFLIAHLLASPLGFPADGFSAPYQFMIQLGSIFMSLLGLWYLRKALLSYFSDSVVAIVLVIIVFATNYFNYAAIDNGMTHNWLFAWYAMLIYFTIKFYENYSLKNALKIGAIIGVCALTRPTDIVSAIIPLLWGLHSINLDTIKERLKLYWTNKNQLILAGIVAGMIGMVQLCYYRYAGGEWLIYTYAGFGFSWKHPHFMDYMFSFRTGWLLYTPVFFLAIFGIYFLIKKKLSWLAILGFIIINTYIVTAWDIWWYGGRAMIQSYPVIAFLLAAFVEFGLKNRLGKYILFAFIGMCVYYNVWWTHNVHKGGLVDAYNMNKKYFYKVVGRWHVSEDLKKLYDTNEYFDGERHHVKKIFENNFETDTTLIREGRKIMGSTANFLNAKTQFSKEYELPIKYGDATWIRANVRIQCIQKEWNFWQMTQVLVKYYKGDQVIKQNMARPQRFMVDGQIKDFFFDVKSPKEPFTKATVLLWNADSQKEILFDDLYVEQFD